MPKAPSAPLEVVDLRARYGEREVLGGVSFRLQAATIGVVLGGSGCGKSTLLRHCVGLLRPASGHVRVFGEDVHEAEEARARVLRMSMGVLFQSGALLGDLTVRQNVMLPMQMLGSYPEALARDVAQTKLRWLGLGDAAHAMPSALSGGMRKRAALARALALEPHLLFCDEPSAGLDPITAAELDELLLRTRDTFGTTMLVVTHELASIDKLADQVVMLANGRVIADGPLATVRNSQETAIRHFFERTPGDDAVPPGQSLFDALGATL